MKRIPTHVDGLDEVLGGGVPEGNVVLVSGSPGTMKTTPFIPCRRRRGRPTVRTVPRPSSKVRTTALSGAGREPMMCWKYSSTESVT